MPHSQCQANTTHNASVCGTYVDFAVSFGRDESWVVSDQNLHNSFAWEHDTPNHTRRRKCSSFLSFYHVQPLAMEDFFGQWGFFPIRRKTSLVGTDHQCVGTCKEASSRQRRKRNHRQARLIGMDLIDLSFGDLSLILYSRREAIYYILRRNSTRLRTEMDLTTVRWHLLLASLMLNSKCKYQSCHHWTGERMLSLGY